MITHCNKNHLLTGRTKDTWNLYLFFKIFYETKHIFVTWEIQLFSEKMITTQSSEVKGSYSDLQRRTNFESS